MDDLTKDALAEYLGKRISMHEPSMDKIEAHVLQPAAFIWLRATADKRNLIEGSDPLDE